jgi:hypothetical protein
MARGAYRWREPRSNGANDRAGTVFALVAQDRCEHGSPSLTIAPLARQLKQHAEQIDEVEIERQSSENRLPLSSYRPDRSPKIPD